MPESKLENFVFTVMMAFVMVYAMICYNIALTIGGMRDAVLLDAFREMMIMWPVAIILEMFVFEKPVVYLTQRLITPETPILLIILIRCSITVCLMCPTMSLIATALFNNFQAAGFIGTWLQDCRHQLSNGDWLANLLLRSCSKILVQNDFQKR